MVFISLDFIIRFGLNGHPVFKYIFKNNTNGCNFLSQNNFEKIKHLLLSVNLRVI